MSNPSDPHHVSRREFNSLTAGTSAAMLFGTAAARAELEAKGTAAFSEGKNGLNILFLFTDQERFFPKWPRGMSLPAHERLQKTGTTFTNHYTSACMCTPSRSVLMTGLQTADNKMFDNCDTPWQNSLSPTVPTIGHMLRKAGYYTAYKGKWHLNREFDSHNPTKLFTREMEEYGFADYASPGDLVGHDLGGYQFDHLISGSAITWLRRQGRPLSDAGKPWSLFVSLVNPHDVMYFNTDAPGQKTQDTGKLLKRATQAPNHPIYKKKWDMPVAKTLREPLNAPHRPKAHGEFLKMWDYVLGHIPLEEERWRRFNDFYLNSIRSVDIQLQNILNELDALGLAERTIILFTSDHGEMAGGHGLRGKGPFAYEEATHIPFFVVHPDVKGGQSCKALSSHIDVVPTLLSMAGLSATKRSEVAGRDLPGKDLSPVLAKGAEASITESREGVLFAYSALCTNDSTLLKVAGEALAANRSPKEELEKAGYKPDLRKRGSVRTVFDGRYKFSRYFAPIERNHPTTLDELYKSNDVELFDHQSDPEEVINLAADREKNAALLLAMSAKLEAVIKAEIGKDDGREMPEIPKVSWYLDTADL
ncbi:sulfatase-like hydrolase/transferase [Telmatocola sphagniphila]|uniref:Sulfatase-like hydrolase/transferase n=1 Tax=Telmatocola sphagniphila TaxID=1123043 RepID=A0A8E6B5D8_9BACT|nr:sulfatase-like hydrolase/transferase [Telmatocola sphagniphila]QVL30710.1 sulfatase-like hydrolase/transferase [Telmatocola sphagniphila]